MSKKLSPSPSWRSFCRCTVLDVARGHRHPRAVLGSSSSHWGKGERVIVKVIMLAYPNSPSSLPRATATAAPSAPRWPWR